MLTPEVQQFINANVGANLTRLALQKNPFPELEWPAVLGQIAAKTKAKDKLPTWFAAPGILYPSKISVEQTSSEVTARYKSEIVSGNSLIDLTGGFGVDDYYFARRIETVLHCERDPELSRIAGHNFEKLGVPIRCESGDSTEILSSLNRRFDWIFIDPSRRHEAKGKVFLLGDCEPDVPSLLEFYFRYSDRILIKTAPLLDIAAGLSELRDVREIHVVAVDNEVRELLWVIEKGFNESVNVKAVNLLQDKISEFNFNWNEPAEAVLSEPKKYLYEPNAAIMKSGGFNPVSQQYALAKLHPHSHLYTSDSRIDFPGRVFEIRQVIRYSKASMKPFQGTKANVTTRNFPESVEMIRKKYKIRDGGPTYCFFTTDMKNAKIVLICAKI